MREHCRRVTSGAPRRVTIQRCAALDKGRFRRWPDSAFITMTIDNATHH